MLAEMISTPEEYLAYSKQVLTKGGFIEKYQKIATYYEELCREFKTIYASQESFFKKLGGLLAIDAQLQILLELVTLFRGGLPLEMEEEQLVAMIQQDQASYYRELTGASKKEAPKWGLIYLSEK